jgi:hypothetical protein
MHYLIPFAAVGSEPCAQAWAALHLPHLHQLMQRLTLHSTDTGDAYTQSPPHERALAKALGLWTADGCTPWAAYTLGQNLSPLPYQAGQAWAQITPCYWHVGTDQLTMLHPDGLQLNEADSRAVMALVQPYFAEDGIQLHYASPLVWYALSPLFDQLATASLDRVVGRNVNAWMPEAAQAAPLRRLQNEMQMLLYTHPLNERRLSAGQLPVNSFWVSGAGALPAMPAPVEDMQVLDDLRKPALQEDWAQWAAAWQALDASLFKDLCDQTQRGQHVTLTLCGERAAQRWQSFQPSALQRFTRLFGQKTNKIQHNQL